MRLPIAVLALALALSACTPATSISGADNSDVATTAYEKRVGFVTAVSGVYSLRSADDTETLLTPGTPTLDLTPFASLEVEAEGTVIARPDGIREMQVLAIVPRARGAVTDPQYTDYTNRTYSFVVRVPLTVQARDAKDGATFTIGSTQFMRITAIENPLQIPVQDFLKQKYGFTDDQLSPITVDTLFGYQYTNDTGRVLYLGGGKNIFALTFLDSDAANKIRNQRYFLDMTQSFHLVGQAGEEAKAIVGFSQICGLSTRCATGLTCQKEANSATGTCQTDAQSGGVAIPAIAAAVEPKAAPLTNDELSRGWYYGDITTKRPGTPDTWELVDTGTPVAMWRIGIVREYTVDLERATIIFEQLTRDRQRVAREVVEGIALIAPEKPKKGAWQVDQLVFIDPRYVYITYHSGEEMRRVLAEYTIPGDTGAPTLDLRAYARPSSASSWQVTEGVDSAPSGLHQVLSTPAGQIVESSDESRVTYRNTYANFELTYPSGWYWRQATKDRAEFSDRPFPKGQVRIAVEVINGADYDYGKGLLQSGQLIWYAKYSNDRSIRIMGSQDYTDVIRSLIKSIKVN